MHDGRAGFERNKSAYYCFAISRNLSWHVMSFKEVSWSAERRANDRLKACDFLPLLLGVKKKVFRSGHLHPRALPKVKML